MPRYLALLLLSISVALSGCALSPQIIDIYPQAKVSGPAFGQGRKATVEVINALSSKTLGSRGGVYSDTSTITINNDLAAAVTLTAKHALEQLGFNGNSSFEPAHFQIAIEELQYGSRQKNLIYGVDLVAVLSVTTRIGDSEHVGHYKSEASHEFSQPPSEEKNASIINTVLSDTLDRAFSDPNLARFILKN